MSGIENIGFGGRNVVKPKPMVSPATDWRGSRGPGPLSFLLGVGVLLLPGILAAATTSMRQEGMGTVTLMAGSPTMLGQLVRPFDSVLSGQVLETGEEDAAGLLLPDSVVHVGHNSRVAVQDEADRLRVTIEQGYVVFYTDPAMVREVLVETPFGFMLASAQQTSTETGWFSVRHEVEQPGVKSAVSTFAVIEGTARAEGTLPVAGPHQLVTGQMWRIVQGQVPGPPEAGDARGPAEELRELLHRGASDLVRSELGDDARLAAARVDDREAFRDINDVVANDGQMLIDNNTFLFDPQGPDAPLTPDIGFDFNTVIRDAQVLAAGDAVVLRGIFVGIEGTPSDPNWEQFLPTVNGNPGFQPQYIDSLTNGGFSYIQFAGSDAVAATSSAGEVFLLSAGNTPTGWAVFTPDIAVSDSSFNATNATLVDVVASGFRAIAAGEHLAGGPTMGSTNAADAFVVSGANGLQLNDQLPVGFPQLDQATNTVGLADGSGVVASDQVAALGAGRNPQNLSQGGPRLLFLSGGSQDANGNTVNFDGGAIQPIDLRLPDQRGGEVVTDDASAFPRLGTPLAANATNTVGLQFAARGDIVAVIHHTGLRSAAGASTLLSEHFEVQRGTRFSIIRWREGARVNGPNGQPLELEDLNSNPALRNELFVSLCQEINRLVPEGQQTVCGPAIQLPGQQAGVPLQRVSKRLVRSESAIQRKPVVVRRGVSPLTRSLPTRELSRGDGKLLRETQGSGPVRQHLGRVPATPR